MKDYYKVLGLDKSCDSKDVKSKYRKLAMEYHPDKNPGVDTTEKFREVNEAYMVLSDSTKREEYDNHLNRNTSKDSSFGDFEGWESTFNDLWGDIFSSENTKGDDVNVICRLTLEEFNNGCDKVIVTYNGKIRITIKEGTLPLSKLKIVGKGEYSLNGGDRGDMIITLNPLKHKYFKLIDKDTISKDIELSYPSLILGTKVMVDTLNGKIKISIPKNTEVGSSLRLKGQGIGEGDLIINVKLYLPKKLNKEELRLISELDNCPNISKYLSR